MHKEFAVTMIAARRVAAAVLLMLVAAAGIVGNSWFDRDRGRSIGCSADAAATTVSSGAPISGGHGPSRLASATLAHLCGVTLAHADGEVLTEAIAQPATAPAATQGR